MIDIEKIKNVESLPTLPSVATKILELVFDEATSINEIVALVESDQGLSIKVLKIVNSASYGLSREVTSVKHAINLIGFNALKHLVLSVSIYDEFMRGSQKSESLNKATFWQHSFSVALVARELARQTEYPNQDLAYTVGLLHDMGKIIIDRFEPEAYQAIAKRYDENQDRLMIDLEKEVAGESHDTVGAWLGEQWKLNKKIVDALLYHHFQDPSIFEGSRLDQHLIEIIEYADLFCWAQGFGSLDLLYSPKVDEDGLKFVRKMELDNIEIYKTVDKELKNFSDVFNFPLPDTYKFREALMKANIELGRLNSLYIITQKKLERQVTELSSLNKAISFARMSMKLEEIVKTLLNTIKDGLGFDRAFFFLLNSDRTEATGHSYVSVDDQEIDIEFYRIPITRELAHFYNCINVYLKPTIIKEKKARPEEVKILDMLGTKEAGIIPIVSQKNAIALFIFDNFKSQRAIGTTNIETLTIIGNEAGLAIENMKLFNELKRLAITDELTQTYNRRQCLILLHHEFNLSRRYLYPLSILMIDIDNFKKINDTYGHDVGDKVLIAVSDLAKKFIRKSDIFARFGGEEFLLILPQTDIKGAVIVGDKLRFAIQEYGEKELINNYPDIKLTVSLGASTLKKEISNPEEIIKEADIALYKAKSAGKNKVEVI